MAIDPFKTLRSKTIVLVDENIDTDQIIPARFLTTTERDGLGKAAFYDWRYDGAGNLRNDSPLGLVAQGGYSILVAGGNFGCGSSREHAPWALLDLGLKAVISCDIADIFKSNALKNGLLPVEVDKQTHQYLLGNPGADIEINLDAQTVRVANYKTTTFDVEPFARRCLLDGVDPLGALVNEQAAIEAYEAARK